MKEKIISFINKKYLDYIFYTVFFIISVYVSSYRDFWYDELAWTIRFVHNKDIMQTLSELSAGLYNLPLYYVFLSFFYKISISPIWLRIPSIIATMGAIWFTIKFIVQYYGKIYRIPAYLLFLCTPIFFHIALQVRPYAFMLFFSALSYYFYYERLQKESYANIIKFGLIISLLMYSHWYGGLLIACYGFTDLYLWIKKKISFKNIVSYIICFFAFLPWFIAIIMNHYYGLFIYWGLQNSYLFILSVFYNLLTSKVLMSLLLCFIIYSLSKIVRHIPVAVALKLNPEYHTLFTIFFIWSTVYLYGRINPNGSIIEIRYFFILIPMVIIFMVSVLSTINFKTLIKNKIFIGMSLPVMGLILVLFDNFDVNLKSIEVEFYDYKKYLAMLDKEQQKSGKDILVIYKHQNFFDYYNYKNKKIDMLALNTYTNKNFGRLLRKEPHENNGKYVKEYFNTLNNLKNKNCKSSMEYIATATDEKLYYVVKNGKNTNEAFNLSHVCDYDTMIVWEELLDNMNFLSYVLKKNYDFENLYLEENIETNNGFVFYKLTKKQNI
ncbi:MAG: glycosyltransferase family 39 protein [Alphaproteobacteria bacterium]|nr:glycosyltransferase family 39 protein [Alphaproteobacteria bacterium]